MAVMLALAWSAGTLRAQDRAAVVPGMKVLLENARVPMPCTTSTPGRCAW
jgi:hypothetical protein